MLWLYSIGRWHGCCPIRVLPATTILLWIKWLRAFWSSDFVSPVLLKAPANGSMAICGWKQCPWRWRINWRTPKSRCFACSPIVPRPELRPFQGWAIAGCWGNTVCYAAMQPWRTAIRRCWMKRPVDLIWTDPPYNVDYPNVPKNHPAFNRKRPILNDRLGARLRDFPGEALTGILPRCKGAVYIAMASAELDTLQTAFQAAGGHWSTFMIWAKNHFTLGHADYQHQYEAILYGWREGANRHWCGDRDQRFYVSGQPH